MLQRLIDSIGVLIIGKQFLAGVSFDEEQKEVSYELETVFPSEEIKKLAHAVFDAKNSNEGSKINKNVTCA